MGIIFHPKILIVMKKLIFTLCFFALIGLLSAQTFYVSTSGNDANPGTIDRPFRSIQRGLNAGGTVLLRAGIYYERPWFEKSGLSTAPCTLAAYQNEKVIVDGSRNTVNGSALLAINSKSNILVQGIVFQNNIGLYVKGIEISGSGANVRIKNCEIVNIGWDRDSLKVPNSSQNANGILILGNQATPYTNVTVENSVIRNCKTGYSEALTITGNVDGFFIHNNRVHNNTNIGIVAAGHYDWTGAPATLNQARNGRIRFNTVYRCVFPKDMSPASGIYADGAKDIVIEGNTCFANGVGISVGCENPNQVASVSNIRVRSNFIYNNRLCGVFFGSNQASSKIVNCHLHHNTLFRNGTGDTWEGEIQLQNSLNSNIHHNIISCKTSKKAMIWLESYLLERPIIRYNMYFTQSGNPNDLSFDWYKAGVFTTLGAFQKATGLDAQSVYKDPRFVSISTLINLHLQNSSPAINMGDPAYTPLSSERDIDNQIRRNGTRIDIGADEFFAISSLATQSPGVMNLSIYPNPSTDKFLVQNLPTDTKSLSLVDQFGRVLKTFNQIQSQMEIDLSDMPKGLYYLQLSTESSTDVFPVVKQ
jgi:hypothetical protein